jgi:ribose transport system ATP-binding protein
MGDNILEMRGIVKKFPGTIALNNVDLTLERGKILALIGENGAGKSTLMNILMGNLRQDKGDIYFNSEKIENSSPSEAIKKGIAMVPQELNLAGELTVAENIFLGKHIKKNGILDWKSMFLKAEELLEGIDVHLDTRQKAKYLSAAYQQMIVIARTLYTGATLIIFDEPTASLTINETNHLLQVMKNLAVKEGKSLIFISHHLNEIKQIADEVCVLRDGKLVKQESADKLSIDDMIFAMANQKITEQKHVDREYSDENILEVEHLTREHEFHDVSFCVKKGEIFGITGLVGSGRTELISCIYGLTKKQAGSIKFEGREISINSPIEAIKLGIGLVPEERRKDGIFPLLSVQENIMIASYSKYQNAGILQYPQIRKSALKGIEALTVKTSSEKNAIKNLSGGNQQKVILARWVEKRMKLLFLDEPTRGIDVKAKGEIYKLIRNIADQGLSVVIVSSEIDEILAVADQIMVMFEGNVKGIIDKHDISKLTRADVLQISLNN